MGLPLDLPVHPTLDSLLRQRWGDRWLLGPNSEAFWPTLERVASRLKTGLPVPKPGVQTAILIAEPDPIQYLATFLAAHWQGYTVILANPQWGQREWTQVQALVQPDMAQPIAAGLRSYIAGGIPATPEPEFLIATGGTTGQVKFARHSWATLIASVQGFQAHFQVATVNAYCVLPVHHVSGLMQALRVLASGGKLALQPYGHLKQGQILALPEHSFLSLVPTQLQWLLAQPDTSMPWLRQFRAVLLGGAPPWPDLLDQARQLHIPLALTYGMTETASQIATLLPEEFLAGHRSSGRVLPHAQVQVLVDQAQEPSSNQGTGRAGVLLIKAQSLFKGYLSGAGPEEPQTIEGEFLSDDVGYLDEGGYLHLVGRQSTKIITGGENIFPEEVEAALLATGLVQQVCVVGIADPKWGQAVCALVVFYSKVGTLKALVLRLKSQLAPHKQPKYWILLDGLPTNAQNKLDRRQAKDWTQAILGQPHQQ